MPEDLDARLLRYVVGVADGRRLTRAAQRLHVSQRALGRDLRRWEERLGVTLIDRTTGS